MTGLPGYWEKETSGVLRPAIEAYLLKAPMSGSQLAAMRAYLRQWIMADDWIDVDDLRAGVDGLDSREAIEVWLFHALGRGIDPL